MKLNALEHPKTLDLMARLNVSRPTAIGHLELLWAWTGKMAASGDIGRWPDGAIARACDWQGDPAVFIGALVEARLLDRHPDMRLIVHDWHDHAPRWVKSKLSTEGKRFLTGNDVSRDTSGDVSGDSKGSEAKGRDKDIGAPSAPKGEGKRDKGWDALLQSCGIALNRPVTKHARGAYNGALSAIREAERDLSDEQLEAEIWRRAVAFRKKWPNVSLTPTALARRWGEVIATEPGQRQALAPETAEQAELRESRERGIRYASLAKLYDVGPRLEGEDRAAYEARVDQAVANIAAEAMRKMNERKRRPEG